ncbi:hypothetical protein [uncultured Duncaniella sp.]|nr:hypothetical protein [uncultured Duncaniella sp.]
MTDLPTVAKFAIVQKEGERTVTRNVGHYNLDDGVVAFGGAGRR